jgi:hypothetical protein
MSEPTSIAAMAYSRSLQILRKLGSVVDASAIV